MPFQPRVGAQRTGSHLRPGDPCLTSQVSSEIPSGPLSKGCPPPQVPVPHRAHLPHIFHSSQPYLCPTLPITPSVREKELEGGWGGAPRRRRGTGAEREGLLARPGLRTAREHLFLLSSAPVAPSGSGWPQEPLQWSQSRPGSCVGPGGGQKDPGMASGIPGGASTLFSILLHTASAPISEGIMAFKSQVCFSSLCLLGSCHHVFN